MTSPLTTTADRWDVDLAGRTIEMLTIHHRVTVHLHSSTGYDGSVILETPSPSTTRDTAIRLDPEATPTLTRILERFAKTVAAISISRTEGTLTLTFTDGAVISAASDADFEAWEVNALGIKIIAVPGGGEPAVFA